MRIVKVTDHPTVDFAAEELKKYLRMAQPMCGEILIERNHPNTEDSFGLIVDPTGEVMSDRIPMPDLPSVYDPSKDDVIRIHTTAEITTSSPRV